ncbi:hypothetical protein Bpfe_017425 [Biomphalaria pfeifferi]|uniref:Uncharacterized protein n=1 Tax=Biomphalaria pfeifferi TaxID=112525 RepID=A0AAD8BFI3_BIOPF|nr:hypothetical protein Bpfe_017425 [Biomphalaria pfeifferi]
MWLGQRPTVFTPPGRAPKKSVPFTGSSRESRKRNIILVRIDKEVQIHTDLQGLTVIHYAQDYKHQCLKRNLIDAIAA